jgi:WS/DGAT/MGAT family acyltransferase
VTDRLTTADVAFFYLEGPTTPQHVGSIAILDAPNGFDYDRLVRLIDERISLAPRYRQKMRSVPGSLANPVWVDDADFDITYHVRRSALPRPGTEAGLLEFCARIQARLLDRDRPLWEMYLVEGLSGGRVAIVTKTHPSMVDGKAGIDIAEVLLDESAEPRRTVEALWMPDREPSSARLVIDALCSAVRRPAMLADTVRLSARDAGSTVRWLTGAMTAVGGAVGSAMGGAVGGAVGGLAAGALTRRARPAPGSALRTTLGQHRRIAVARTRLDDYRKVRAHRGGAVNDVVLAVVSGALREWLLGRGEALVPSTTVRALVPMGVNDGESRGWTRTSKVAALLVDLPVGEPDPLRRLARVQYAMATHAASGRPVGADALVGLSGFAPPTLHSLGARAAHGLTRRMYSLAVTNVPGPQLPLFAAGAELTDMFPVMPLTEGHALSIGLTSYNGGVFFGINADRDAVPDVAEVAGLIEASLAELVVRSRPADIQPGGGRRSRRRESNT